jgi:putative transposase
VRALQQTPPVVISATTANGGRSTTVLTDVGPVEITVPRDRDVSFKLKIVVERQKHDWVDEIVISL